jgi:multidrug efflux pump subunit AcrA (membrane-fusion protein)
MQGRVVTVIPRGDVATRTFPVKIRVTGEEGLMEGMSAQVTLPVGQKQECLLVPRDAVMLSRGRPEVVVVSEGTARRLPVTVLGYTGEHAGIEVDGVRAGMQVIVKGHERVREGQPVEIVQ